MLRERPASLWRNRDFLRVWAGQSVSVFGSTITREALPLLAVTTLAATAIQMGWLVAVAAAPVLIIGLLAGAWVDRLCRRPILIAADLGRAGLLASIPLTAIFGGLSLTQLYIVAGLVGVLTVFFEVADQSFLPTVVERDQLLEANSKLGTSSAVAEVGGPALAGVLVQLVSAPFAIALDALSFIVSALCLGAVRKPEAQPPPTEQPNIWREIGEGLRVVWATRLLRAVVAASATRNFFGSFFATLYGLYVLRELSLSPAVLGLLVGAGGIGSLVGAFLAERLTLRWGIGPTLIGSLAAVGGLNLLVPLAGGSALTAVSMLLIAQLLGDTALTIYFINETSLRQALVPNRLLGRANASAQFVTGGVLPIGAIVAGFTAEGLAGIRLALLIGVLGMLLSVLWLVFSPVRTLRQAPNAEVFDGEL